MLCKGRLVSGGGLHLGWSEISFDDLLGGGVENK